MAVGLIEIRIHRRKRVVYVDGIPRRLTQDEYDIITALGISDNRLVTHEMLSDVVGDSPERPVLWNRMYRLRKRIGPDVIQTRLGYGYVLSGDVGFIG